MVRQHKRRIGSGDVTAAPSPEVDLDARERSLENYRLLIQEWATGRLPGWAREGVDTNDLVQVVLIRAWNNIDRFANQPEDSLRAFMRRLLQHEVIDRIRSAKRHPGRDDISDELPDGAPNALDVIIEEEFEKSYRALLDKLKPRRRETLVLRLEGRHSYVEIAAIMGGTANAARMRVARALEDLATMTSRSRRSEPSPRRSTDPK